MVKSTKKEINAEMEFIPACRLRQNYCAVIIFILLFYYFSLLYFISMAFNGLHFGLLRWFYFLKTMNNYWMYTDTVS